MAAPTKNQLAARLRRAAYSGNFKNVISLLKEGADPNCFDKDSYLTPLHYAAGAGHADVCQLLIDNGAIVDAANAARDTPLLVCLSGLGVAFGKVARRTHPSAVLATSLILLEAGANPKHANTDLKTPLHAAASIGYSSILEPLLKRGADPKAKDSDKSLPLHLAAYCLWDVHGDGCRILLGVGSDPNAKDIKGNTPLHNAAVAMFGREAIMALLEAGSNVRATNKELTTPLHVAASCGRMESSLKLVEAGADLFAKDLAGKTPKEVTIKNDSGEEVEAMLAAEMLRVEMQGKVPKAKSPKTPKQPVGRGGGL